MGKIIEKRAAVHRDLRATQNHIQKLHRHIQKLEPLANIGLASAMIAHELNNILTPVLNYGQLAQSNPSDGELTAKALEKIVNNSLKATNIARSVMHMAQGSSREKVSANIKYLVENTLTCLARDFSKDRIRLTIDIPEDLDIVVDAITFQQVFMNMILNARQAMKVRGGELVISARRSDGQVHIRFADTGCGIHEKDLPHIFDPFFSTKGGDNDPNGGSGLGLTFSQRVVREHHGTIEVESASGKGTTFTIRIPDLADRRTDG